MLLVCFLVVANLYGLVNPLYEASDEYLHVPVVRWFAEGRGLPIISKQADLRGMRQEAAQPPLYYLLLAPAYRALVAPSDASLFTRNPYANLGQPGAVDNRNIALHGPDERVPFRGTALAVHLLRVLSTLMAAATVFCVFAIVRRALPGRPLLALAAATLAAGLPEHLFVAGSVNNDNLVNLLAAAALLLLLRWPDRAGDLGHALAVGVVIGLAALAKLSGLLLLPLALLLLAWMAWRARRPLLLLTHSLVVAAMVALVAGWWYLRNLVLYGDPTGLSAMLQLTGQRRPPLSPLQLVIEENEGLRWSFWGMFGGFNLGLPRTLYLGFDLLLLAAGAGLCLAVARSRPWRQPGRHWRVGLLVVWAGLVGAALLRWSLLTPASQGRLLYPALATCCLLLVAGWAGLVPGPRGDRLALGLSTAVFAVGCSLPFTLIQPAYTPPSDTIVVEGTLPASARPLARAYGDRLRLVGYELGAVSVLPGETLPVTLYWRRLGEPYPELSVRLRLYDAAGRRLVQRTTHPVGGLLPASQWPEGALVRDRHLLEIPPDAAAPSALRLELDAYEPAEADPPLRKLPPEGGSATLAWLKLGPLEPARAPALRTGAPVFAGVVDLVGYSVAERAAAGSRLEGQLVWRARRWLDRRLTVSVQLQRDGVLLAQEDAEPQGGTFPTLAWPPGMEVADDFTLHLPPEIVPGPADLVVRLYHTDSGEMLTTPGGMGHHLAVVEVVPPSSSP